MLSKNTGRKVRKIISSIACAEEKFIPQDELVYVTKGTKIVPRDKAYVYSYAFFIKASRSVSVLL